MRGVIRSARNPSNPALSASKTFLTPATFPACSAAFLTTIREDN